MLKKPQLIKVFIFKLSLLSKHFFGSIVVTTFTKNLIVNKVIFKI